MYKIALSLFLFLCAGQLTAQVYPKEGSRLYYRIIGFSSPVMPTAVSYKFEVATGNYTNDPDFEKKIIISRVGKDNKVIAEVPAFGAQYTWRVTCTSKSGSKVMTALFHFSTRISPDVDDAATRLRVIKPATKYKDAYVFLDCTHTLYDMKGKPVWFMPGSDEHNQSVIPRDLKITPFGSITFITGDQPVEISYSGKILWRYKGNRPNQIDSFHHEFTHLQSGNYMGMVYGHKYDLLPEFKGKTARNAADSAKYYSDTKYTKIVEYDTDNHLLWQWSTLDYRNNCDLAIMTTEELVGWDHDLHDNSVFFDEKHKVVYLSFRNINRIIKISYPDGNVLNTYGPLYQPGKTVWENEFFCHQHSCRVSENGNLYLFNNNVCGMPPQPRIIVLEQPGAGKNELKKLWEFTCPVLLGDTAWMADGAFKSGGNVLELPDHSFFVSMSVPYANAFIVGRDKKIVWSALPEKYDAVNKKWGQPLELYRASIITTRKQLETLIWNSEKG